MKRKTILYVAFWPWSAIRQLPQHMAEQLAKSYEVIYASPKLFHMSSRKISDLKEAWSIKSQKVHTHLTLLDFTFSPSWRFDFMREYNHRRWAIAVKDYLKSNDIEIDLLWLSSPEQVQFLEEFNAKSVYHCFDSYESFYPKLAYTEPQILRHCNITIVTSQALKVKAERHAKNVYHVPNGVEYSHFRKTLEIDYPVPNDLLEIDTPVVGYIGSISHWMDYQILRDLSKNKNLTIVLIGPIDSETATELGREGRAHLLNRKEYSELPSYLAHFDVCIIPFLINELTRAVDPVKIYEYLAAGRRVVSTPLPEIQHLSNMITIVEPKLFAEAVASELEKPKDIEWSNKISNQMLSHSWDQRGRVVVDILAKNGLYS